MQSLQNCYYFCIYKLFKFNFKNFGFKEINDFLRKFNIFSFEYRIFYRLSLFINKILYSNIAPINLKKLLIRNKKIYNLRNKITFFIPKINNHFGEYTFQHFFGYFLN